MCLIEDQNCIAELEAHRGLVNLVNLVQYKSRVLVMHCTLAKGVGAV
jgi:hypothetical protein